MKSQKETCCFWKRFLQRTASLYCAVITFFCQLWAILRPVEAFQHSHMPDPVKSRKRVFLGFFFSKHSHHWTANRASSISFWATYEITVLKATDKEGFSAPRSADNSGSRPECGMKSARNPGAANLHRRLSTLRGPILQYLAALRFQSAYWGLEQS